MFKGILSDLDKVLGMILSIYTNTYNVRVFFKNNESYAGSCPDREWFEGGRAFYV